MAVAHLIDDGCGVNRLAGAIDGTVGVELGLLHQVSTLVVTVAAAEIHLRRGLVRVGIGEYLLATSFWVGEVALALAVGHEVVGVVFTITDVASDAQVGLGDGLTRRGAHHHVADSVVRLFLGHRVDIGHVIETADNVRRGLRLELNHIHAYGQGTQGHRVFKQFVVGLARVLVLLGVLLHQRQQRLQFLVVLLRTGVQVQVAVGLHLVDLHRHLLQVAQVAQQHLLLTVGQGDAAVDADAELGRRQRLLIIAQGVHLRPRGPLAECLAQIFYPVLRRIVAHTDHTLVALDGQCAGLGQVAIDADQRVEPQQSGLLDVRIVLLQRLQGRQTGSLAITRPRIVVVQRLIVVERIADDAQQVVAEHLAVCPRDDEGLKGVVLHLCQFLAEGGRQFRLFRRHLQRGATPAYLVDHRLVDRLQHLVLLGLAAGFQPLHLRRERVGGDAGLHLRRLQFSLHQLAVGFLALGLLHDLLQHVIRRLGQVLLFRLSRFLPQGRIGLPPHEYWHRQ